MTCFVLFLGSEPRQPINTGAQAHTTPANPAVVRAAPHQEQPNANFADAWADRVLGGLEDYPPCQHCLMSPCITVSEVTRTQGSFKAPQKHKFRKLAKGQGFVVARALFS